MAKPSPIRAIAVAAGLLMALLLPLFALRCNSAVPRKEGDDDITLKAKELGFDVGKCLAFVDDEVKYEPYPGFLRGPTGALWASSGSDADRAALLKALLERCGAEVTFAGGPAWGVRAIVKGKELAIAFGNANEQPGPAKEPDASEFPLIKFKLGSGTTWIEKEWRVADQATTPFAAPLERGGPVRRLVVTKTPYIIAYRIVGDELRVLTVHHGARRR